jgi:lytic murein transglycosylase
MTGPAPREHARHPRPTRRACRAFPALVALLLAPLAAPAQDGGGAEHRFRAWLEETAWPSARAEGISRETFTAALSGVTPDRTLPGLAPPDSAGAARQAEFGAPAAYFAPAKLRAATAGGRRMARRHGRTLATVSAATGVPARIILAVWGRESAYGRAALPHDAFAVLATRAFLGQRRAYFTRELIAALRIVQQGHAPAAAMKSSWAGALGQPQFMPTSFLAHAADGDGDGRADIWQSEADTIASIGRYLARHGWVAGRDWGFEVRVPEAVSCALEGPDRGRPIADWARMGIARVSGRPFPEHELAGEGYLLMPAGRHGPAFVATPNFYVLKDYNMSDLYALFVGHVGDRIAFGMGDFHGRWGDVGALDHADITAIQRALVRRGHDVGGVDGLPGHRTRRAIGRWQAATGRAQTCFPSAAIAEALAR